MWIIYSVDCPVCNEGHAFRGVNELPNEAVCNRCNANLLPNGKIEFEELCVYCGHQNFFSEYIDRPKCKKCGFTMPDSDSVEGENSPIGVTKSVAAGLKTGDLGTIIMILGIIIGIILMISARS